MPKFVIEREIAGASKLASQELKAISQKSCSDLLMKESNFRAPIAVHLRILRHLEVLV